MWPIDDSLPADGRWHHVGMVKTGSTVIVHIDYSALATNTLDPEADGTYIFDTKSRVSIGWTLNGANASGPEHIFDEVRLSDRALSPNEFLHLGRPIIRNVPDNPANPTWNFDVWTIPGEEYDIETADGFNGSFAWSVMDSFTATSHVSVISSPQPTGTLEFMRLKRDMP